MACHEVPDSPYSTVSWCGKESSYKYSERRCLLNPRQAIIPRCTRKPQTSINAISFSHPHISKISDRVRIAAISREATVVCKLGDHLLLVSVNTPEFHSNIYALMLLPQSDIVMNYAAEGTVPLPPRNPGLCADGMLFALAPRSPTQQPGATHAA